MKFKDLTYKRIVIEDVKKEYDVLLERLENALNKEDFLIIFNKIDAVNMSFTSMYALCYIRHSINTEDEFYQKEEDYYIEVYPHFLELNNRFDDICLNTKFRAELKDDIPEIYFLKSEFAKKTFKKTIIEDLQEESKLVSKYDKLKANARVMFENKEYNLSMISAIATNDNNRERRYFATMAIDEYYQANEDVYDDIYDKLVKVRTVISHKLGFKNFVELAYYRMDRFDYDEKMVAVYRKEILDNIVPLVSEIKEHQRKRLGYTSLNFYDESYEFKDGNARLAGTPEELVSATIKMFDDLSKETGDYIHMMNDNENWDLLSKNNKVSGGYCETLTESNTPFIFSNFNGTIHDVEVLTHENGHGFQSYMSRNIKPSVLRSPTLESCEIHSMSMEFFAYDYLDLFFGDDAKKFQYSHLTGSLVFLPYGVLVDHFQHEVYKNPKWSPKERKDCWRKLEKQYLPHRKYEEDSLLSRGGYYFRQGHIFEVPFYYIDYTLAQVCALQFYSKMKNNDKTYFDDYKYLCSLGGTKTFTELVKAAKLTSPFEKGCLNDVKKTVEDFLENSEY